jgi:hypothetical protein
MIWGSKTLLEPAEGAKNGHPRSVGVPVNVRLFLESAAYRQAIPNLQLEIWNHELSDHLLFFGTQAEEILDLCTRHHKPHIDTIIWLLPESSQANATSAS